MTPPTAFRIDTHVPLPPRPGRRNADLWTPWPFAQMGVGDSFFVDATSSSSHAVSGAAATYSRDNPDVKFSSRWVDDDINEHKPGIRVWRTK